jgi:predicted hotdog family 3-hydroxylacyl-ACP dehydratase
MSSLVNKSQITEYIPQKKPIIMVDTIESFDDKSVLTTFKIENENIFVSNGVLNEPGIVENIAQTAAARAGYEVKLRGIEPLVGFIGAVKDLEIHYLPKVGETIQTRIEIKMEVMGVTLIQGESTCGEKKVANCEMKIFLQKPEGQD